MSVNDFPDIPFFKSDGAEWGSRKSAFRLASTQNTVVARETKINLTRLDIHPTLVVNSPLNCPLPWLSYGICMNNASSCDKNNGFAIFQLRSVFLFATMNKAAFHG